MRNFFAETLASFFIRDSRLVLLNGDIGNRLFDGLKTIDKQRVMNCGIAEANMCTFAAGLASQNYLPLVYSITPFVTTRVLEQIKLDICYHKSPVMIVGTGSGLAYTELGATHHSLEDINILKPLPNIRIYTPADPAQIKLALEDWIEDPAPAYMRIGKKGEACLERQALCDWFGNGMIFWLRRKAESKTCVVVIGLAAQWVSEAMASRGLDQPYDVLVLGLVKPIPESFFLKLGESYAKVLIVEENYRLGGIGETLATGLMTHGLKVSVKIFAAQDNFCSLMGGYKHGLAQVGLGCEEFTLAIEELLDQ